MREEESEPDAEVQGHQRLVCNAPLPITIKREKMACGRMDRAFPGTLTSTSWENEGGLIPPRPASNCKYST